MSSASFPIYLNKELFLLPCFPDIGLVFVVAILVVLTFDLAVLQRSCVQTEWMGDGCSWRQGREGERRVESLSVGVEKKEEGRWSDEGGWAAAFEEQRIDAEERENEECPFGWELGEELAF